MKKMHSCMSDISLRSHSVATNVVPSLDGADTTEQGVNAVSAAKTEGNFQWLGPTS